MGLTPLEGVAMGTRSGDIDPAIINHLAIQKGLSIEEIDHLLNRESGLLGISEISNDVRDIQKAAQTGNSQARQALEVFAYRVRKYIGSYLAVLAPLDAIVFTGGIGENAHEIRQNVLEDLESLGILISESRNRDCKGREAEISEENSPIKLWVIPTNEELLIARDSRDLLLSESAVQD